VKVPTHLPPTHETLTHAEAPPASGPQSASTAQLGGPQVTGAPFVTLKQHTLATQSTCWQCANFTHSLGRLQFSVNWGGPW
jgi:hypothetical protein